MKSGASPRPSPPSWFRRDWIFWLILALAALGAYANSLAGPFIFDDGLAITNNPSILHLWPIWAPLMPDDLTVGGRPIFNLSLALNYATSGMDVWSYHAVNLTIHILAGLTLLGVARRTLLQPVLRAKFGADASPLALAIALLWTLHPLQTESVTYISQRSESLMGLFYLLTLYAFIRAAGSAPDRRRWMIICVGSCFLGMATKEVMVTAPLMALLYDRTFVAGSFREAWRRRRPLYAGLAASWALLIHPLSLSRQDVGYGHGVTTWAYALTECGVLPQYLKLVFWPFPLVLDYGASMVSHPRQVLPQALFLAVLLAVTAWAFVRRPAIGFAGVWFFLILAPSSSVIPVVLSPMAEHRLYLSLAAPVTLVVLGLYAWMGRLSLVLTAALALACGLLTFERNQDYGSEIVLWRQVTDFRPGNARAHNNLGLAFFKDGQLNAAMGQYQEALQIDPQYAQAHSNLGVALMRCGRVDEAILELQRSLEINPNVPETIINFGIAVSQKGRLDDGMVEFQKALKINPNYAEAHIDLGIALAEKGRVEEAIAQFQEALRLKPGFVLAQNNLARAQAMQRQAPGSK